MAGDPKPLYVVTTDGKPDFHPSGPSDRVSLLPDIPDSSVRKLSAPGAEPGTPGIDVQIDPERSVGRPGHRVLVYSDNRREESGMNGGRLFNRFKREDTHRADAE